MAGRLTVPAVCICLVVYWSDQRDSSSDMPRAAPAFNGISDLRDAMARRTFKDIISDKISALIASGVLRVGDELPGERELATALAVSRETVRGAVRTLAARGVLEVSHGSRTRVASTEVGALRDGLALPASINRYDIDSVHEARLLVEREVVAQAAAAMDEATLAILDASLAAQGDALADPVRFLIIDREFHATIYRGASNALLADFVIDLYAYMIEHRRIAVSRPGAIRASYEDHLAIVEALRARDPDATAAAFERHLRRITATTRSVLDDLESASDRAALSAAG